MKLNYTITQENYEDVIAFQLRLQRSKKSSLIQYLITNGIFIMLAVYFFFTHPDSAWWMRFGILAMAVILLLITTDKRSCSPRKVRRTYRRYVRLHLIQEGYLGTHTLIANEKEIIQKYGEQTNTIETRRCAWVNGEKSISMILGGGVIFEIIPNEVLDQNDNREKLKALIVGQES